MLPQVKTKGSEGEEALDGVLKNVLLLWSEWVCIAGSFSVQHMCPWLLSKILFTT